MNTEQEKFEEWAVKHDLPPTPGNWSGNYKSKQTAAAWIGWQARAALKSKPVKSCETCKNRDGGICTLKANGGTCGIIGYTGWQPIPKSSTAIDRLRNNPDRDQYDDRINAILELDSRLREMGK